MTAQPTATSDTFRCGACGAAVAIGDGREIPYRCGACGSRVLDGYYDLEPLGDGAMGQVFRARPRRGADTYVAIKIPKSRDESARHRHRFEREIVATSLLTHENVVRAFHHGEAEGRLYLVMQYVDGRSLAEVVRAEHPLAPRRAAQILRGIAAGLAHAEQFGIVNRDIKPENILIAPDDTPKILDYGLALVRSIDKPGDRVTQEGVVLGTLGFMAPEQARNPHEATILSDIYSLGCTAYFLLTEQTPFRGGAQELFERHAAAPRPDVTELRRDVPVGLAALIQRMMAPAPADRPTPGALLAELDRLLPRLPADEPDWPADDDEPVMGVAIDTAPPLADDDEPFEAAPVEWDEPQVAVAVDEGEPPPWSGEADDEEPILGIPAEAVIEQVSVATSNDSLDDTQVLPIPAASVVDDEPPPLPAAEPAAEPRRRKGVPRGPLAAVAASLLVIVAVLGMTYVLSRPPDPEVVWAQIQEDYQLRKWTRVMAALEDFAAKFPDSPRAAEVPFFIDMCRAGDDVFSTTGDADKGLATIDQIFQDYRDTAEYNAYCSDLYMALVQLVERFIERSEKSEDPQSLPRAHSAFELLTTVAQAMTDDWQPARTAKLRAAISQAEQAFETRLAKNRASRLLTLAAGDDVRGEQLDAIYERVANLQAGDRTLAGDKELADQLAAAYRRESERVQFHREAIAPAAAAPSDDDAQVVYVVWDEPPVGPPPAAVGETFAALARGVLYVFDADGRHLWSRRLGFDSSRQPLSLRPSPTSPDAYIAISTLDNSLLALAKSNGHELWRYQAGSANDLSAPLTISRWRPAPNKPEIVRGLLPTASGEIHVLELVQGRRIGRFTTGFPMTVGGVYDPDSQLAYFPAESNRVFAIDPAVIDGGAQQSTPARSVLFTRHASGALRSEPVIVGPYLLLIEAHSLEHTKVRVFQLQKSTGFADPVAQPLVERALPGWAWFTPPATPDRLTVVTDEGVLGVFGVNLDNPHEALYSVIQDAQGRAPRLPVSAAHRALAIRSDEHLLWCSVGGQLRLMALDVLNQETHVVWPEPNGQAAVDGIPLHQAALDAAGRRLFVTTKSTQGDDVQLSSVDAFSGDILWRRKLGLSLAADPLPLADRSLLLIDRSGRLLRMAAPEGSAASLQIALDRVEQPAASGPLQILTSRDGGVFLLLPLDDGRRVAVRNLREGLLQSTWSTLDLPAVRLQGSPAVLDEHLVVPGSDGRLHRLRLDGQPNDSLNELPFEWAAENSLAPHDRAALYPLDRDRILEIDRHRARWLSFQDAGQVRQWKQDGVEFLAPQRLDLEPLVTERHVYLSDGRTLFRLAKDQPMADPPHYRAAGRITSPPFAAGGQVFVIEDRRRVVCFSDEPSAPDACQPIWSSAPTAGRIAGRPFAMGSNLLVTDESGAITALRGSDGEQLARLQLAPGASPAASAAGLGAGKLLAPLTDGSLLWRSIRSRAAPAAEATPATTPPTTPPTSSSPAEQTP